MDFLRQWNLITYNGLFLEYQYVGTSGTNCKTNACYAAHTQLISSRSRYAIAQNQTSSSQESQARYITRTTSSEPCGLQRLYRVSTALLRDEVLPPYELPSLPCYEPAMSREPEIPALAYVHEVEAMV